MIYMYSDNGDISKYPTTTNTSHIIEYKCSYRVEGVETIKLPYDKYIYLACATDEDVDNYIMRYEECVQLKNDSIFHPIYERDCIQGNDGEFYTYWSRRVIEVNPNEDYYFYANSEQEKEMNIEKRNLKN